MSTTSYSSLSSTPVSPTQEEKPALEDDEEAIKRTIDSFELQSLRERQLEERERFLAFQRQSIKDLREEHRLAKYHMHEKHVQAASDMEEKNTLAADDLESRQLEAEAKFRQELEAEKRACLIRLKYMEAYCHTPSPPATPRTESNPPDEHTEHHFPERKITDKDFHNLAAQYRERDHMDSLHKAKIEVMQGRQEKVYNDFVKRKEKELATLVTYQEKSEAKFVTKCEKEEHAMVEAFDEKRLRLQCRWKLQGLISCSRLEREHGLRYAPLPDITFELDHVSD